MQRKAEGGKGGQKKGKSCQTFNAWNWPSDKAMAAKRDFQPPAKQYEKKGDRQALKTANREREGEEGEEVGK